MEIYVNTPLQKCEERDAKGLYKLARRGVIKELNRISKPGLRKYSNSKDLPTIKGGLGIAIVSTNQGLMTDEKAREKGIGGEVICSVF